MIIERYTLLERRVWFWYRYAVKPVLAKDRHPWVSRDIELYPRHLTRNQLWNAQALARALWAMNNPGWLVWLFGDRWQKRYRRIFGTENYISGL